MISIDATEEERRPHCCHQSPFDGYTLYPFIDAEAMLTDSIIERAAPHPSSLNDTLPGQELGDHKMADILIGPIGQMASDARPERDVEEAPRRMKRASVSQRERHRET